jgi:hypothetical protein
MRLEWYSELMSCERKISKNNFCIMFSPLGEGRESKNERSP